MMLAGAGEACRCFPCSVRRIDDSLFRSREVKEPGFGLTRLIYRTGLHSGYMKKISRTAI